MSKGIIKGHIVFTPDKDSFMTYRDSYLVWEEGRILGIYSELREEDKSFPLEDFTGRLIIPGFVDIHLHAPQFPNKGIGYDKELIPWLETYTFPEESKYGDLDYSERIYSKFVRDLWRHGTTSAAIYSSVHKEGTKLLMDKLIGSKLRAYVGKVNMDRNTLPSMIEDTANSIMDTEEIIMEYKDRSPLVKPIITPRFVPTCTPELMEALGEMALKYDIPVQSHLNENRAEVEWVKELHPDSRDYSSVYDKYGLFGQSKTIMAHCVYNTDEEIELMAKNQVYVAHCPDSNYNLSSGIMPVRKYLDQGVPIGLGSDIAGGHTLNMLDAMVSAIQASKMKWLETNGQLRPLSSSEAFYLATKGGGSFFGRLGSFEKGYALDALVVDDSILGDVEGLSLEERIQRYMYKGDYNNILARYVDGKRLEEPI